VVDLTRFPVVLPALERSPVHELDPDIVGYLMPSRYCQTDEFQNFVGDQFGALTGGTRIVAISDWIRDNFSYVPGASNSQTTAMDTFAQRQGVCRDYAHMLITLARASAIPARMVSAYAPDVDPQDFHAVAEVFLQGKWHLVDPTGMSTAADIAVICVGRDAADVAFLNSFGSVTLRHQSVTVTRIDDSEH
jgi:transglutaminase-like putative cysteine protease